MRLKTLRRKAAAVISAVASLIAVQAAPLPAHALEPSDTATVSVPYNAPGLSWEISTTQVQPITLKGNGSVQTEQVTITNTGTVPFAVKMRVDTTDPGIRFTPADGVPIGYWDPPPTPSDPDTVTFNTVSDPLIPKYVLDNANQTVVFDLVSPGQSVSFTFEVSTTTQFLSRHSGTGTFNVTVSVEAR